MYSVAQLVTQRLFMSAQETIFHGYMLTCSYVINYGVLFDIRKTNVRKQTYIFLK